MKNSLAKPTYLFVIISGFVFSMLHMRYWADKIAINTNYFISLGILPIFVGFFIGCIGSLILEKNIKKNWKLKATGAIAPLVPIIYTIGILSF